MTASLSARQIMLPCVTTLVRPSFSPIHNIRAMSSFSRLVRFIPKSSSTPLIGEPVNADLDVGLAAYESKPIEVEVFSGTSVLKPGEKTGKKEIVERLLSPLAQSEVGTIRCIGLNVSFLRGFRMPFDVVGLMVGDRF